MNNLKPCKTCGREVSTNASKCPHCGEVNPTTPPPKPFSEQSTVEKGISVTAYIIVIIICIVVGIFILALC